MGGFGGRYMRTASVPAGTGAVAPPHALKKAIVLEGTTPAVLAMGGMMVFDLFVELESNLIRRGVYRPMV